MLNWQWCVFPELTPDILYAILKLRQEVFVVEQNCVYLDIDDVDQLCWHIVGFTDIEGEVTAYTRVVPPGVKYAEASIGRVVTSPRARGTGVGRELMEQSIRAVGLLYPDTGIRISAQQYLEKFYSSLGFVTVSDMYLEDDIPHIEMLRS